MPWGPLNQQGSQEPTAGGTAQHPQQQPLQHGRCTRCPSSAPQQPGPDTPGEQRGTEVVADGDGESLLRQEGQSQRNAHVGRVANATAQFQCRRAGGQSCGGDRHDHQPRPHDQRSKNSGFQNGIGQATAQQQTHHAEGHAETHQWLGEADRQARMAPPAPETDEQAGEQLQQEAQHLRMPAADSTLRTRHGNQRCPHRPRANPIESSEAMVQTTNSPTSGSTVTTRPTTPWSFITETSAAPTTIGSTTPSRLRPSD